MVNKNSEYLIIEKNIELLQNALIQIAKEIESLRKLYVRHFLTSDLKRLFNKEKEWEFNLNELKYWQNKKIVYVRDWKK